MANKTAPDATRRSQRSRQAICEAALALVGETGYDKLTIEGIAARAGVGKQTIYRWWPSKGAVLLDAFTEGVQDGGGTLPDTGDLATDLKAVLRATVDEFNDPAFQAPYRALYVAMVNDSEVSAGFTSKVLEPGTRAYADRIRAAQEAGEVDPDADPELAAEMILSPFAQRWLLRSRPLTHAFTDRLVDQALAGLRPRRA
ncbi:TetR family transcriptional regulator [Streptomyces mashuensis]|uniref:TetR family transcriptional regulator n=1 Tax=Streptomyces mashuensis TaxID=33904 RepID=A0A919AV70_9ACTN|nr:TetR/AcrR family transcriptional regulator [Streptomyces mashuensis]GHF24752.1 TetR family transcriptional regulator [Streptomyces mashuensis]